MDQLDNWQDATLNGIPIQCETIEDSTDKALAVHELPNQDRVILEDMGLKAWRVRLRCYFWGDTYSDHSRLLGEMRGQKAFELNHPAYGLMRGCVESISIRHDDRIQAAEIDISFVEGETAVEPILVLDVKGESETAYMDGLDQAQSSFADGVKSIIGAEASEILTRTLDTSQGILEQFTDVSRQARNYVKTVDTSVRVLEAKLQSVATPANALVSTINFAANLPGRVVGAIARTAGRYSTLHLSIQDAPDRYIQSYRDSMTGLSGEMSGSSDNQPFMRAFKGITSLEAGAQVGNAFNADEEKRRVRKRREKIRSFDVQGRYLHPDPLEQIMSVNEIEATLYMVREMLLAAIVLTRQDQALKRMALALQRHAVEIKINRAKIKTVTLDNPMPLQLVLLKYGLPYNMADRLLAINSITDPNNISGDINIYAI